MCFHFYSYWSFRYYMKEHWIALWICPPWGNRWDPHPVYWSKELSNHRLLGVPPKTSLYALSYKGSFHTHSCSFLEETRPMATAATHLQQRQEMMLYTGVSSDRSWNILDSWWKTLAALWEKSWEMINFERKWMWLCKVESNPVRRIRITQFSVLLHKKCLGYRKWKENLGIPYGRVILVRN